MRNKLIFEYSNNCNLTMINIMTNSKTQRRNGIDDFQCFDDGNEQHRSK